MSAALAATLALSEMSTAPRRNRFLMTGHLEMKKLNISIAATFNYNWALTAVP
jgi:hypothetical protein